MERRKLLQLLASTALLSSIPAFATPEVTAEDDQFLDDFERRGCLYFVEQAGARTGQVLDRAVNPPPPLDVPVKRDPRSLASIAATGFGLSALCIAEHRGYMPRAAVLAQVKRTLKFHLLGNMPQEHGFLYHFNDVDQGGASRGSEVSPIDTSIFLCGALTARAHFHADAEVVRLATQLYHRVDWPWMLNGADNFAMGWRQGKFLPSRWNRYCELMMMYLLAIGSPTHPVRPSAWAAFSRPHIRYDRFDYISDDDPLFVHQYSHAWFDFRDKRDAYANYFQNSVTATQAHQAFCLALGPPYNNDYWGISASDSAHGYTAWGGPSAMGKGFGGIDGSVVPCATAGSLPFTAMPCLRVLRWLQRQYPRAWGRYGFCDAFHPAANWYDPDVLGIDVGIGVLMAENLRSGFVWNTFMRNPEVGVAMQKVGFHDTV